LFRASAGVSPKNIAALYPYGPARTGYLKSARNIHASARSTSSVARRRAMTDALHVCVDCGMRVPPHDDNSALISMKYGWRLVRKVDATGKPLAEWRCPRCWSRYRETHRPMLS
jgi:hypothetical protein